MAAILKTPLSCNKLEIMKSRHRLHHMLAVQNANWCRYMFTTPAKS